MASTSFAELRRRGVVCGTFAESEREVDFVIGTTPVRCAPLWKFLLDADAYLAR